MMSSRCRCSKLCVCDGQGVAMVTAIVQKETMGTNYLHSFEAMKIKCGKFYFVYVLYKALPLGPHSIVHHYSNLYRKY